MKNGINLIEQKSVVHKNSTFRLVVFLKKEFTVTVVDSSRFQFSYHDILVTYSFGHRYSGPFLVLMTYHDDLNLCLSKICLIFNLLKNNIPTVGHLHLKLNLVQSGTFGRSGTCRYFVTFNHFWLNNAR